MWIKDRDRSLRDRVDTPGNPSFLPALAATAAAIGGFGRTGGSDLKVNSAGFFRVRRPLPRRLEFDADRKCPFLDRKQQFPLAEILQLGVRSTVLKYHYRLPIYVLERGAGVDDRGPPRL